MGYIIKKIEQLDMKDNKVWGNKIAYLSDASRKGFIVPKGFGVAFDENYSKEYESDFNKHLIAQFCCLKRETGAKNFIVRSSAQGEDRKNHVFPGIYKSKENIEKAEQLLDAIEECYKSFLSDTVKNYKSKMRINGSRKERCCLLVQEQIQPELSGVVFTRVPIDGYYNCDSYLVELVRGHCGVMLQGKVNPEVSYIISGKNDDLDVKRIWTLHGIYISKEKELLRKIKQTVDQLVELYGSELDIEWGYENGHIIIFQIRPIQHIKTRNVKRHYVDKQFGLKAEAMEKFSKKGLFPKKLLIIEPGRNLDEIRTRIEEAKELRGALTVRYSCGKELGLPRGFLEDKAAVMTFINNTYNTAWTIILHESICVCHSYELYIDKEKTILEHVPGMWESDSKIATDVWIFRGNQVTAYASGYVRNAKYESAGTSYYRQVEPYSEYEMKEIAEKVHFYIQTIKEDGDLIKGNNLHFVEDEKGLYYFLNYRNIQTVSECVMLEQEVTVINTLEDFSEWRGGDVLLKIDLKRGQEVLLEQIVPLLKKTNAKVFVEFGILSHPAILLREFGIEIFPSYTLHKKYMFEI